MQSTTVADRVKSAHPTEPDSDDELTEVFTEKLTEILPEDVETTKSKSLERVRSIQSMVGCAVDVLRSMSTFLETPHAKRSNFVRLSLWARHRVSELGGVDVDTRKVHPKSTQGVR